MLKKKSFGLLYAIGFTFISCAPENKKDNPIIQSTNTGIESHAPSDEFTLLEKKLEQDSLNTELRELLATKYYAGGVLDKAAYHFLNIYQHDNKNLIALSNLGNIYYDSQQNDQAIAFYNGALEIDVKNIDMRCDLATCYSRINKNKKAIQLLRENIQTNADHGKSHYNLSVILKQTGNTKEAESEMNIYKNLTSQKN